MTIEYLVVPHKEVNEYLRKGWNLYGSPVAFASVIWQAITKATDLRPGVQLSGEHHTNTQASPKELKGRYEK